MNKTKINTKTKEEKLRRLRKIKKRRDFTVDFFKTAAIFLLTVSMLTTAGLYINERQNAGRIVEIPREKISIIESGGTVLAKINENQLYPVQITITVENRSFTAIYNYKLVSDIYESFVKYSIRGVLNKNSECRRLDKDEGDELWRKCVEKDNSVYVRYAGNYVYPVIYAFLDEKWDIRNSADAFSSAKELAMVHEIFIVDEEPVYGVAKDIDGNVSVFMPETETGNIIKNNYINTANLSAYNNYEEVIPCEFLKGGDISLKTGVNSNSIRNLNFPDAFHLFYNYNTYSPVLQFSNPILDLDLNLDENDTKTINTIKTINTDKNSVRTLFKILNFNIESAASYPDKSGITFRNGQYTVRFYNNGQIIYSCKPSDSSSSSNSNPGGSDESGGGIHLSKFLAYDTDYYTLYEKIKAASLFVSSVDKELTGNECSIYLKNIIADEADNLKVAFSYYYEGIQVKVNGENEAAVITISRNSITEVKINSLCASSHDMVKNISPILYLNGIDSEIIKDIRDFYAAEFFDYDENGNLTERMETDPEEAGNSKTEQDLVREIEQKYKLRYDKIQDKFIVNRFELAYNIDYSGIAVYNNARVNDTVKAAWEIKYK